MVVSLYINNTKTQVSILEQTKNYFGLKYINMFEPINLENIAMPENTDILSKIGAVLSAYSIDKFFVTISPDYYTQTYIPYHPDITKDEIDKLLNFEVKQYFPAKNIDNFRYKISPLSEQQKTSFAVLISKDVVSAAEMLVATLGYEMTDINPTTFAEVNAFCYNYADIIKNIFIIVQINKEHILEYILLHSNKIIGYECVPVDFSKNVANQIETRIEKIIKQYNINDLSGIFFFGDELTKQQYVECWEIGMIFSGDSKRLNPFRMLYSEFDKRDIEYIARTFHFYVQCIGGGLPTQIPVITN